VGVCPEAEASALEAVFAAKGCHVGFIGSPTMALYNLASAHGLLPAGADVLILNRTPRYVSFLFVEDGAPLFFRCRDLDGTEGGSPSDDRLAQELRLTLAYYREKLGGTRLSKILLRQWPQSGLSTVASLLDEDILPVEDLEAALGALPSGQPRGSMALPLFGLVEGGR
jgi:hypothetical protein